MSFAGKYTVKCTIYTQLEKKNERHVAFDVLSHPFQIYSKLPNLARDLIFDLQFIEKLLIAWTLELLICNVYLNTVFILIKYLFKFYQKQGHIFINRENKMSF